MNSIGKTLFGRLYYLNKQSHFQFKKGEFYCESFSVNNPDSLSGYYGLFGYNRVNLDKNFELYSNLVIGCKSTGLKWQEKYRYLNDTEYLYTNIPDSIVKVLLTKDNRHIINCSCCHRY